ncbi:hypothetical protein [Enterovirga sp.]|uniref:hypothetical protein n=1 Tax=Enterovirga sp. TaxID=2026350 RepID=UPI00262723F1|nr:hypothetical protein [Enterovirga sp.]MDB5589924.1 hypothetical protein [Enterovirga sp.]
MTRFRSQLAKFVSILALTTGLGAGPGWAEIDNSALAKPEFREHVRTFGVVYTMPADVNDALGRTVTAPLREKLLGLGLLTEAVRTNIAHVTVVHIHNSDSTTPDKMLAALPKPPAPFETVLKRFYTTEAATGAGHPWWLDLGIEKTGPGYETMMSYNTEVTAALAPLRDGPLPRVTGPVYAKMGDAAKSLVQTMGVSGVNVVKDGKELRSHNPHLTLVYSMAPFAPSKPAMDKTAEEFNQILPAGLPLSVRTVSIVELGFTGNVSREIYRINLADGSVLDVASGQPKAR